MAADPNPALRAELTAARDVLAPQLRGLHFLATVTGDGLQDSINAEIAARTHRDSLLQSALDHLDSTLAALTALEADGYPALPHASIVASQFEQLQEELRDLTTAAGVFDEQASMMSVGLGAPADKAPAKKDT